MVSSRHSCLPILLDTADGLMRGAAMAIAILAVLSPSQLGPAKLYSSKASNAFPAIAYRQADFGGTQPSADVRSVADWVANANDNKRSAFVIIDKRNAKMYVFDQAARLRAATTILLGAARGDDTAPGIGMRPIADVRPEERTTPAGRFLAERGHDSRGEDVVWIDYEAGVSMHRVLTTNPSERRLERLASSAVADKRISYGCINVPKDFYEAQIRPMFAQHPAMVYVLPEVKPIQQVFKMAGDHLPS